MCEEAEEEDEEEDEDEEEEAEDAEDEEEAAVDVCLDVGVLLWWAVVGEGEPFEALVLPVLLLLLLLLPAR